MQDAAREISGLPFSCLGTRSLPPWLRNPQKVGGKTVWPPKLYYGWVLRKRTGEKPRPQFVNTTVNPPQAVDFYQIKTVYCKGGNLTNILVRECNYALPKEEAPFGWMTEDDFKVLEDYYEDARPGEKKPRTGGWYVSYKQGEDAYNAEFCWTSKPKPVGLFRFGVTRAVRSRSYPRHIES